MTGWLSGVTCGSDENEDVAVKSDNLFSFCFQISFNHDFKPSVVEGNSDSSYLRGKKKYKTLASKYY